MELTHAADLHPHAPFMAGVHVTDIVAMDAETGVRVASPLANRDGIAARTTIPIGPEACGQEAVVVFEDQDPARPIIIGLIQEAPVRPVEGASALVEPVVRTDAPQGVTAVGERLCLEAREEIVLRCGKSSITLRRNGHVLVRGMKIVSRARGLHKVKGAAVLIN